MAAKAFAHVQVLEIGAHGIPLHIIRRTAQSGRDRRMFVGLACGDQTLVVAGDTKCLLLVDKTVKRCISSEEAMRLHLDGFVGPDEKQVRLVACVSFPMIS